MSLVVTYEAVSEFQVAFLDAQRCWRISQPMLGVDTRVCTYWPPLPFKPGLGIETCEAPNPERHAFPDLGMATLFVQQQCIKTALEALFARDDLATLLPFQETP